MIHGLLGRNGAGKTTLMQMLTAQGFATSGQVRVFGEDPWENAEGARPDLLHPRGPALPRQLHRPARPRRRRGWSSRSWDEEFASALVDDFGLRRKQRIKKLSRGQLSAVGVVIGLASRAPLTFFDEPYLGLDAVARQLFYDRLLADYAEHPRTVVLSTHLIDEVSDLIEHVVLIDQGRILLDEDADALRGAPSW